jgi:hypothetical protein
MKVRVYVVDFEIPPRVKKWGLRIGIPAIVLSVAAAALAAAPLHTWSTGDMLQATDLNGNFTNLQGQITALQSAPISASGSVGPDGSIVRQTPQWLQNVPTHTATGTYTFTFESAFFSSTPDCAVTGIGGGAYVANIASLTQSGMTIETALNASLVNDNFEIVCVGLR